MATSLFTVPQYINTLLQKGLIDSLARSIERRRRRGKGKGEEGKGQMFKTLLERSGMSVGSDCT